MKLKFENVKVGDIVYIKEKVTYEWHSYESFFIPTTVIKVTKTQFKVSHNNIRFNKSGVIIGGNFKQAYFEGENEPFSNKKIKDETDLCIDFKKRINIVNILKSKIDSIGIDDKLIFNKTKDDLLKALNAITEFEHIIKD